MNPANRVNPVSFLTTLNRWHNRNLVAFPQHIIAIDKLHVRTHQNASLPDTKRRKAREQFCEQITHRRSRFHIKIETFTSGHIAQP